MSLILDFFSFPECFVRGIIWFEIKAKHCISCCHWWSHWDDYSDFEGHASCLCSRISTVMGQLTLCSGVLLWKTDTRLVSKWLRMGESVVVPLIGGTIVIHLFWGQSCFRILLSRWRWLKLRWRLHKIRKDHMQICAGSLFLSSWG